MGQKECQSDLNDDFSFKREFRTLWSGLISFYFFPKVCLVSLTCIINIGLLDECLSEAWLRTWMVIICFATSSGTCIIHAIYGTMREGIAYTIITGHPTEPGRDVSVFEPKLYSFYHQIVVILLHVWRTRALNTSPSGRGAEGLCSILSTWFLICPNCLSSKNYPGPIFLCFNVSNMAGILLELKLSELITGGSKWG